MSEDPTADLEKTISEFNALIHNPENPTQTLGAAWRFLQVYSTWGLRLPYTEAAIRIRLGTSDTSLPFFGAMIDGYSKLHEASSSFLEKIFPDVIEIGTSLRDFASDASANDGDVFGLLVELLNEDPEGALELVNDLQKTASTNEAKARTVTSELSGYKSALEEANTRVKDANNAVEASGTTSQATIDKLSGGPEVQGSLKQLANLLEAQKDDYDHYVVVASTTVTYAWVVPPVGLIAAASVAGVYGKKAVDALDEVERQEKNLLAKNAKLNTAIQTRKVMSAAGDSLGSTLRYTDMAISHATTVQNSWSNVVASLSSVNQRVTQMTKTKDEQEVLGNKRIVERYAKTAGEKWQEMVPILKELTRDPYIKVEAQEKSMSEFAADVRKELDKAA